MIANNPVRPVPPTRLAVKAAAAEPAKPRSAVGLVSGVSGTVGGGIGGAIVGGLIAAVTTRSLTQIAIALVGGLVGGGILGGLATGKLGRALDDLTGGFFSKFVFTGFWGNGLGFLAGLKQKIFGGPKPATPPTAPSNEAPWYKRWFGFGKKTEPAPAPAPAPAKAVEPAKAPAANKPAEPAKAPAANKPVEPAKAPAASKPAEPAPEDSSWRITRWVKSFFGSKPTPQHGASGGW